MKIFPDDSVAEIYPLTYGRARIGWRAATSHPQTFDDVW